MNPFKDVKTSAWYGSYVIDLYNDGIINGTSATTYAPNDTLTWGAALKLLLVSSGNLKAEDATGADWLKNTMAKAVELGIAPEDADGKALITRLAFCQTAAKLNKLAESKTESPFTDCTDGYVMAPCRCEGHQRYDRDHLRAQRYPDPRADRQDHLSAEPDREVRRSTIQRKERCFKQRSFLLPTGKREPGHRPGSLVFRFAYR